MIDEEKNLEDLQAMPTDSVDIPENQPQDDANQDSQQHGATDHEGDMTLDQISLEDLETEREKPTSEHSVDTAEAMPEVASTTIQELTQEIATLKAQLEDRTGQYVRIAADFDNFRKRTQKEREEMEEQIKCSTIVELLPVVDNFERARSQIKPQTDGEMNIHKSYQSVYKQLVECLKRIGVSPMRAEGQEFDPTLHEAVMRENTNEYPDGTVMEELVRGYQLGSRVLRHAMVKVAAASDPVIPSNECDQDNTEA
jgi:molecular chaperone GrpE